ncbi:hypothetical protein MPTK1_4g04140 [Marchantia polymorpha subsp. ruderalis]|uniref:Uncharacterized protein n=2 Tax=Marchantia polymorpha TaxID=3197 RepID=A0AAF6B665_MARPO|nr:hypothetical protein MARPO_0044s0059 [Marchantia polymorpha]PTQ39601.1 hypothetical protein MARPO_0044s0059 [Marchantia polymorpha]BBN07499.1 hypothetical protein Mp_4g04140 [Marchantia polymorpha subsp. ruderalis]BBN07500.1 hypothetical protein Mp_4g04140 [Marchantia polymorpha subsp. ruderalis]|eukprot:PTQ39600.1 hypothetical protein MARPO_0044s0059 [Marchantia polymorpha]
MKRLPLLSTNVLSICTRVNVRGILCTLEHFLWSVLLEIAELSCKSVLQCTIAEIDLLKPNQKHANAQIHTSMLTWTQH